MNRRYARPELEALAADLAARGASVDPASGAITIPAEPSPFARARALVLDKQLASATWLANELGIGKPKAIALIDQLEAAGVIGPKTRLGDREILLDRNGDPRPLPGHNSRPAERQREVATDDRLRLLIERVERLEEEKKGIADDIRDVYGEAKGTGYDAKIMREMVRLRKMNPDDRREIETITDLYKSALGMG